MQIRKKTGLILMSLLLVFSSLPVSAAEFNEDAYEDTQSSPGEELADETKNPENPEKGKEDEAKEEEEEKGTDETAGGADITPDISESTKEPSGEEDGKADVPSAETEEGTAPSKSVASKEADTSIPSKYDLGADGIEVRFKNGQTEYVYTGAEIKPEIEVVLKQESGADKEASLDKPERVLDGKYYTAEYQNNIETGEASIVLTGRDEAKQAGEAKEPEDGNEEIPCIGVKTVKFKIIQADINNCELQVSKSVDYTGKQVKPEVVLTYEGKRLVEGKDYQLACSNNKAMGTASVRIDGIGNFKGSKTEKFQVKFGTPVVKASSSYSKIKLKWQKVKGAAGYVVYRSTSAKGKFKKVKTYKSGSKTSYSDTKAKFGKTYYYKVRAYRNVKVKVKKKTKTKQEYGSWSAVVKAGKKLGAVTVKSAKCASETSAKITWKRVSGAQGYEIYKCKTKDGNYVRAGKVSGGGRLSYTAKKLKMGVTYYFKVKAYRKAGSKKHYGALSAAKKETFTDGQRLYVLFPDGVPTSKAEMERYLVEITVPIKDEDGVPSVMQLRVHKDLTKEFMGAFQDMYAIGFPVRAEDTDTYNWRSMASGRNRSHHSYGCVVDLNWNSNPMIGVTEGKYQPGVDPYSVTKQVVAIWKKHGFFWGGDWKSSKDYMHFTYTNH